MQSQKDERIIDFNADDIHIGYNPPIKVLEGKTPKSLTIEFHTANGWCSFRLNDDICDQFDRIYHEHTNGRLR